MTENAKRITRPSFSARPKGSPEAGLADDAHDQPSREIFGSEVGCAPKNHLHVTLIVQRKADQVVGSRAGVVGVSSRKSLKSYGVAVGLPADLQVNGRIGMFCEHQQVRPLFELELLGVVVRERFRKAEYVIANARKNRLPKRLSPVLDDPVTTKLPLLLMLAFFACSIVLLLEFIDPIAHCFYFGPLGYPATHDHNARTGGQQ
jgi:hypothetical protein